mmetsp:Transcript_1151/g.1573  ORF Transcript_1151/g.1573 Transcript_1151/m.1573 type:complete len:203 (-) Transcript_1151:105-713(-)
MSIRWLSGTAATCAPCCSPPPSPHPPTGSSAARPPATCVSPAISSRLHQLQSLETDPTSHRSPARAARIISSPSWRAWRSAAAIPSAARTPSATRSSRGSSPTRCTSSPTRPSRNTTSSSSGRSWCWTWTGSRPCGPRRTCTRRSCPSRPSSAASSTHWECEESTALPIYGDVVLQVAPLAASRLKARDSPFAKIIEMCFKR